MSRTRRVLVIDDDRLLCELVRTTFELEGFEVDVAYDVIEAERSLVESRPDAILLDIGLPGIDGIFYLERLRDTRALLAGGPRVVTKAILFPVRFMYTLRTGRIGLNDNSAQWYAAEDLPGGALALKALEWRNDGIADAELASQMLGAELDAIHGECFAGYAKELDDLGEARRAAALAKRAASVQVVYPHAG